MMRTSLCRLLPALQFFSAIFMLWKGLSALTNSPYPAHVVISDSMAPAFKRGDVIVLSNWEQEIRIGEIPVVWFSGNPLPMVHRAINTIWGTRSGGQEGEIEQLILTKGDNNEVDDVALYPSGQKYVYRSQIIGVVRGYLPILGWMTILLSEYPYLKFVLIGGLAFISMIS
ncbi:putative signal peptidase I [Whalleya microplaca]|nr:putative signal peptidase I [Whalleya microplaca]